MKLSRSAWILIMVLLSLIFSIGLYYTLFVFLMILSFFVGVLLQLLTTKQVYPVRLDDLLDNPLEQAAFTSRLQKLFGVKRKEIKSATVIPTQITGNKEIDGHLHDIIGYIIRDYVTTWYEVISQNPAFPDSIKLSLCKLCCNISDRTKKVDWTTYLLGRVVEDFVEHLRLFRAAQVAVGQGSRATRRGSPAPSPSKTRKHKRNKSDTDVASSSGFRGNSRFYIESANRKIPSFEEEFFNLEAELGKNSISRQNVCMDNNMSNCFYAELVQMILFATGVGDDASEEVSSNLVRDIGSMCIKGCVDSLSDPDTLNTSFLKLIPHDGLSSEAFLLVLRTTNNIDELLWTQDIAQKDIQKLVSRDTGGEDIVVKQQLSSMNFLLKTIKNRICTIAPATSSGSSATPSATMQLPMGFLLDNHLALCYFLDFAQSFKAHPYIFCYISIQAWRVSTVKYLSKESYGGKSNDEDTCTGESVIQSAQAIYEQYIREDSPGRLAVSHHCVKALQSALTQPISEATLKCFDQIEDCIMEQLTTLEADFRNSIQYSRLLAELDIDGITNFTVEGEKMEDRRTKSTGQLLFGSKSSLTSLSLSDTSESGIDHQRPTTSVRFYTDSAPSSRSQSPGPKLGESAVDKLEDKSPLGMSYQDLEPQEQWPLNKTKCHLETHILETGLVQDRGKSYGIYAVEVKRTCPSSNRVICWHVYHRYSDFHELNSAIKEQYPELSKLEFPSKKTFQNKSRAVLERRMLSLGVWLATLASLGSPGGPPRYHALHASLLLPFLSPRGPHDKPHVQPAKTILSDILVQPFRQGMRTLRGVPGHLYNTVDDIVGGLSKVITGNRSQDILTTKHHSTRINLCNEEGIPDLQDFPLQVMLILIEEIFDLQNCNRWLRRQIAALLRQLLTAMFASVLNRKIIDSVSSVASPETVAFGLKSFKDMFWPGGECQIGKQWPPRDEASKARARVAAKTALLSGPLEELKRIIGSETTHKGLISIFELFQNPILNKRLIFVLAEGLLCTLCPEHDVKGTITNILQQSMTTVLEPEESKPAEPSQVKAAASNAPMGKEALNVVADSFTSSTSMEYPFKTDPFSAHVIREETPSTIFLYTEGTTPKKTQ